MRFCSCDICNDLMEYEDMEICVVCKTKYCKNCKDKLHNYCRVCNTKIYSRKFDKN